MWFCAFEKPVFPCFWVASRATTSVGGIGDFCQRSGNKSDTEPNDDKSLNRYNTSTKYSHSLSPCRRALDKTDITIADQRADSGLPKNNQFFRPTTNSRNVLSETLLSIVNRPSYPFHEGVFSNSSFGGASSPCTSPCSTDRFGWSRTASNG